MLFSLLKLWSSGDPYYFEVRHVFEKGGDAQAQKKGEGKKGEKKTVGRSRSRDFLRITLYWNDITIEQYSYCPK